MRSSSLQAVTNLLRLGVIVCLASSLSAQYRFDHWTTENGLPENSIWAIRQSRDGYLWMTTSSGIVRFDGVQFREFNRGNTPGLTADGFRPYALLEDREGCLWAGTRTSGAVRFCRGVFTTFTTKDGLAGNDVVRIDEDEEGSLWFFSDSGLTKWKDGRMIRVAPEPGSPFNEVLTAPWDKVGVDGHLFGFWRIGRKWQRFAHGHWSEFPLPGKTGDGSDLRIRSIVEDSKGRLWYRFYSHPGTYYCLYKDRLTIFAGTPAESFVSYQDLNGNLWMSAHDGHTTVWKDGQATLLDGFSTSHVFRGLEDQEGSLWLGTARTGLFRATPAVIATVPPRNVRSPELNLIEAVIEDRTGGIWYGSHGLFHLRNNRLKAFYHAGAVPRPNNAGGALGLENIICALYQDRDGTIWAGTWDGLARLSGDVLVSAGPTAGIRGRINAIHRDRDGDFWIGGDRGLYRLHGTTLTHFTHTDGLGSGSVQVIREGRSGALWVGTTSGLYIRHGSGFSPAAAEQGPDVQNITALYEDETGVLWIGTSSVGLFRLEREKVTHYTDSNGLSTNSVFQILEDSNGYLWLSGRTGIHRVKRQELNAFAAGRQTFLVSTAFGRADGMRSADCSSLGQPTGIKAKDGKLWFPTSDGLAVLDPSAAPVNGRPPPVVIEEARVDGRSIATPAKASLAPGELSLELQYTALSFIKSGQIRFRYKMEGLDSDWIDAGARRTAYYTRIPPGDYTFRVIAANSDGVWNTEGAQVAVSVLPPFYRTWWFGLAAVLSAAALIAAAWRYRVSQLERAQAMQQAFSRQLIASQEEERKRIAAELHDSLGQRLVIVKNLAMFFLRAQGEDAASNGKLRSIEEISAEAALAIDETREISYNLRPFQLDRLGLTKAVEGIVRTASTASPIHFFQELDNIDEAFPEDLRINFYRIVQECVSNVMKHAEAREVTIRIERTADQVLLTVRDNGKGFTPGSTKSDSEHGGFGVTGMAERTRSLGGSLSVQSAPGQGTTVFARIPIAEPKK